MEGREHKVAVSEGVFVYGVHAHVGLADMIIFVHGLPGSCDDQVLIDASVHFQHAGFSTYRMNLYASYADARQMKECSVAAHVRDIGDVVAYFKRDGYERIHVIGHSFGCIPLLAGAASGCTSVSLWEPTYRFSFLETDSEAMLPTFLAENEQYILNWGVSLVVSKTLVMEIEHMAWDQLSTQKTPTFIAYAAHGVLRAGAERYFENAHGKKHLAEIKNADHAFSCSPEVRKDLYTTTTKWIAALQGAL